MGRPQAEALRLILPQPLSPPIRRSVNATACSSRHHGRKAKTPHVPHGAPLPVRGELSHPANRTLYIL